MSVSVLLVIVVDVRADEHIRDALHILTWYVHSVHDGQTDLVLFDRLRGNIPDLLLLVLLVRGLNLEPACDDTLGKACALVVDLSLLDGLLLDCLPVAIEEAIIQVDRSLSNEVVTEQVIEVVSLDLDHGRAWELTGELEELVELGVGLIKLIVVTLGELAITTPDEQVRVAEGANITTSKVETLKHIKLNLALSLAKELLLDDLVVAGVLEEFKKLRLVDVHRVE